MPNVKTKGFLTLNRARVRAEVLIVMKISLCFIITDWSSLFTRTFFWKSKLITKGSLFFFHVSGPILRTSEITILCLATKPPAAAFPHTCTTHVLLSTLPPILLSFFHLQPWLSLCHIHPMTGLLSGHQLCFSHLTSFPLLRPYTFLHALLFLALTSLLHVI